jgi:FAD/FMN-containing dehydrogenase
MNRRDFCQGAIAATFAGAYPAYVLAQASSPTRPVPSQIAAAKLSGGTTSIEGAAVRELAGSLRGTLLLNGDFGYDGARRVWNGMHERFPAMIVRAAEAGDVASAVMFARERELLLAVKGGGHSWPGHSVADEALMIDLGALNQVAVDVARRRARVGGGAILNTLDYAAQRHGLATTAGVVSHTGVGGLTLGGGFGRLNRKLGLTIDNLLWAQVVTADGQIRQASATENADLFWAIRGGGGNYGVVTEFEFALHPIGPVVLGGDMLWPLAMARDVLEFYAEYSQRVSDEMYVGPEILPTPDGAGLVGLDICYCGDLASGERELAPVLQQLPAPASNTVAPTPYLVLQTRLDGVFRPGIRSYIKSGMVREFTPALIDSMVESFDPSKGIIVGSHTAGGAVARVDETATAWPHRRADTMILAVSVWDGAADDERMIQANREQWAALEPHTGGYYDNIQAESAGVQQNYGPVYDRLVSVKTSFDPTNLFRLNSNIRPTA